MAMANIFVFLNYFLEMLRIISTAVCVSMLWIPVWNTRLCPIAGVTTKKDLPFGSMTKSCQ